MGSSRGLRRWVAAGVFAVMGIGLMGYSTDDTDAEWPSGSLAIVVGAHGNMPQAVLAGQAAALRDYAVTQQSFFSVVVADGAPYVAESGPLTVDSDTANGREEQRRSNRQRIDTAVVGARAKTPETDLLTALQVAATSTEAVPGPRTIVVLDPGLSTTGPLNLTTPDLLDAVPQEVADTLGRNRLLPILTDATVVFTGLGVVSEPQQPLTEVRHAQLEALWTTIVRTAGAAGVQTESLPAEGAPPAGLPPVTPVVLPRGYTCDGSTMTITGGELAFEHDEDVFLDPPAARAVFRAIARQINEGQLSAVLHGMTADVLNPSDGRILSYLQAQAIANIWLDEGVPQQQLTVVGLGSDFPEFVPDHDADGNLMPAVAAANRTIEITFSGPVSCDPPDA
jgi:outer membrane protein OmpA-like peptidoglycan-associated protein